MTNPHILLVQGPNMEYLGLRQPEFYGTTTATELDDICRAEAENLDIALEIFYTNTEGEAIRHLLDAKRAGLDGLVMNPAGFLYAGTALADTVLAIDVPYVEVHMTNIEARGKTSVLAPVATGMITGLGVRSYILALEAIASICTKPFTTP